MLYFNFDVLKLIAEFYLVYFFFLVLVLVSLLCILTIAVTVAHTHFL
jgi:hypothetical protein